MTIAVKPKASFLLIRVVGNNEQPGEYVQWNHFRSPMVLLPGKYEVATEQSFFGSAVAERGSIRSIRSFAPGKGSLVERKRYRTGTRGEIDIGVEFEAS